MTNIDFSKIKLIIWDLDDTFWKGTLSEEVINPIVKNIQLVKQLTDIGIINSICSKNTEQIATNQLKTLDIDQYFVFKSINWEPKGQRISTMIKEMGLRPVNVLFIDDNPQNLNEALFYEPNLMTALPNIIDSLSVYVSSQPITDSKHNRLKQYRILEEKQNMRNKCSNNTEFLFSTNTQVRIHKDCLTVFDRLYELTQRTNQLNFTKLRSTKEELSTMINDPSYNSGYVTVEDKFGDYGIVGFFVIKNNKCIHFLFSCRTIGQGVEQYVYAQLNYPILEIVGEVVNMVDRSPAPAWINQKVAHQEEDINALKINKKIIIKGACDLDILNSFLSSDSIKTEFTYIGEKHNHIEHHNHSINILQWHKLNNDLKQELLDKCIFNDREMFNTSIFDDDVALIFLSSQIEPNLGIYQNKKNGIRIAFAEWCYPLTDERNWDNYINNKIPNYGNKFTKDWFRDFAAEWDFIGTITADEYINNIKQLLQQIHKDAKICILLGSEIPYEKNTQKAYENRHLIYKQFNDKIKQLAKIEPRILLLPFSDFIKSQDDFLDNINHYQRRVYFDAAKLAKYYIQNVNGIKIETKNIVILWLDQIANKLKTSISRDSVLYKIMKKIYHQIRI